METIIKPQQTIKATPHKAPAVDVISALLILLWVYAALSKLADFETAEKQMHNQVFPGWIASILVWVVPLSELITAILLYFKRSRKAGLFISLFLLTAFTAYIALVMTNIFGRIPCNCGGVISRMSWPAHLALNLSFIALTAIALKICTSHGPDHHSQQKKKGGFVTKMT